MRAAVVALACALGACSSIIGVEERFAGEPDAAAPPGEPATGEPATGEDAGAGADAAGDAAAPLTPQTLGQFVDPVLSVGEAELLVVDRGGARSKIVLIEKAAPTKATTIYDEPSTTADKRVSSVALSRGKVWFTTSDGKLHTMGLDGKNPTLLDAPASSILARSAGTVWLVSPDVTSSAPTLRWVGQDLLSQVPEAQIALGGPAMFAYGSDDELVVSSRTSGGQWTLSRWRPFATQPYATFATFDAYPSWVAADATHVLVYSQDEGTVVSWSRVTPQATPTPVLVDIKEPVQIRSDGTNLVLRSQTSIRSCLLASCAASMRTLQVPTSFAKARYLHIDEAWAYFFHAKTDTQTMTLVRVPR